MDPTKDPNMRILGINEFLVVSLGCANKDLDRSLGHLDKFIEYFRIVGLKVGYLNP